MIELFCRYLRSYSQHLNKLSYGPAVENLNPRILDRRRLIGCLNTKVHYFSHRLSNENTVLQHFCQYSTKYFFNSVKIYCEWVGTKLERVLNAIGVFIIESIHNVPWQGSSNPMTSSVCRCNLTQWWITVGQMPSNTLRGGSSSQGSRDIRLILEDSLQAAKSLLGVSGLLNT